MSELIFPKADTGRQAGPLMLAHLDLARCPHCSIDRPNLGELWDTVTASVDGQPQKWRAYVCARCGGVVLVRGDLHNGRVFETFPETRVVSDLIPARAREFLTQAMNSLHSPAGSVMLAASSVDAMLKAKDYKEGTLFARIKQAAADHLITSEMEQWAHQVRLDANDQRHADEDTGLPTTADAKLCIDFASALGEFLFVLPARVTRGLAESKPT